jgi:hypothetical protein
MEKKSLHLSFEKITDLALGEFADALTAEHLNSCPQCELELMRARQLVEVMRTDATEDAPPYAVAAILRAFDERQIKNQPIQTDSISRKIRAILRLDSANLAPSFGFRSAGAANSRQLLFFAGDGTLDLRITPQKTDWIISGQILGQICDGKVELKSDTVNLETEFDSQCEFALPPISKGTYRLRLYSESFDVEVPDLVIG